MYFIAQRKFDEEEDYLAILGENKYSGRDETDDILERRVFVNFAFKLNLIENRINELENSINKFEKEDALWIKKEIEWSQTTLKLLRILLHYVPTADEKQLQDWYTRELYQIPVHNRWMMYSAWRRRALDIQEQRAADIENLFRENTAKLKNVRDLESAEICHSADIVGFTTTGAAKNRALLNHLKPKIGSKKLSSNY